MSASCGASRQGYGLVSESQTYYFHYYCYSEFVNVNTPKGGFPILLLRALASSTPCSSSSSSVNPPYPPSFFFNFQFSGFLCHPRPLSPQFTFFNYYFFTPAFERRTTLVDALCLGTRVEEGCILILCLPGDFLGVFVFFFFFSFSPFPFCASC